MAKGKQIKALPTPDLTQPLSLKLIGDAIRARRTQQKLDRKTAAMLCDVSVVTLGKIENASAGVRMESVLKVMAALGLKMQIDPWEDSDA
ncbi:helix-turn-helix domain-containing protein [Nitratifractor sp.]|uniref:helix-turn-helix domain-containing protein n=1 Tax=Nitratifractor sp. TaxID=2268144 RepID=UPI0025E46060|nr:helix-turn-helix domain-containing protein [Nitratifractor sp.]